MKTGELASMADVYLSAQRIDNPFTYAYFHQDDARLMVVERLHNPSHGRTMSSSTTSYRAVVVVGDRAHQVGVGVGIGPDVHIAVRNAVNKAKMSVAPTRKGYFFERLGSPHTVAFKTTGRSGGTSVRLQPAPRGTGLASVCRLAAQILVFAGIEDVHFHVEGPRDSEVNLAEATFDALKQQYQRVLPCDWTAPTAGKSNGLRDAGLDEDTAIAGEESQGEAGSEVDDAARGDEEEEKEEEWVQVRHSKKHRKPSKAKTKPTPTPTQPKDDETPAPPPAAEAEEQGPVAS